MSRKTEKKSLSPIFCLFCVSAHYNMLTHKLSSLSPFIVLKSFSTRWLENTNRQVFRWHSKLARWLSFQGIKVMTAVWMQASYSTREAQTLRLYSDTTQLKETNPTPDETTATMTEQTCTCRCSRTLFQTFFMLKTGACITHNKTRQLTARGFGRAFAPWCSVRLAKWENLQKRPERKVGKLENIFAYKLPSLQKNMVDDGKC